MSMTIQGVSDAVNTLLTDSGLFQDVFAAPQEAEELVFTGYPSVMHYYSETQNDYATNTQNRRTISYTVDVVLVTPESVLPSDRFKKLYSLSDSVISLFDQSYNLDGACQIMRPVPGMMSRVGTNEGDGLMLSLTLLCEDDINFRTA